MIDKDSLSCNSLPGKNLQVHDSNVKELVDDKHRIQIGLSKKPHSAAARSDSGTPPRVDY